MLAPPLIAWLITAWGWQAAFLGTGLVGMAWLLLWIPVYQPPAKHPRLSQAEREHLAEVLELKPTPALGGFREWASLLRYRQIFGLFMVRVFTDSIWWFYISWLPKYLSDARHYTIHDIGAYAWLPFTTATFAAFAGGGAASWLMRRGWSVGAARKTVMGVGVT